MFIAEPSKFLNMHLSLKLEIVHSWSLVNKGTHFIIYIKRLMMIEAIKMVVIPIQSNKTLKIMFFILQSNRWLLNGCCNMSACSQGYICSISGIAIESIFERRAIRMQIPDVQKKVVQGISNPTSDIVNRSFIVTIT